MPVVLDHPEMFLHHVDFDRRLAAFVEVSPRLIEASNVHNFDHLEPRHHFDLDTLLEDADHRDFTPPSFLFMTDFCGSTLLANGLAELGGVTCLYEVRAFAGVAIRKRLLDRNMVSSSRGSAGIEDWRRVLRLVVLAMSRSPSGDSVIIKEWPPSNYIIADILRCHPQTRALFLYADIEDYLNAVFRRSWRREFTRRRMLTEFVETDLWPALDHGKHSLSDGEIAAAHWFLQQQAFLRVDLAALPGIRSLHNSELYARPVETLAAVSRHFGIDILAQEAARAFGAVSTRHSKATAQSYSLTRRAQEVDLVARRYAAEIGAALARASLWMNDYPIPPRLPSSL